MKKVAPMIILKWLTDNWWNQQVKIILGQLLLSLSLLKVEIKNKYLDRSNNHGRKFTFTFTVHVKSWNQVQYSWWIQKNRVVNLWLYYSAIGLFQLKAPKRVPLSSQIIVRVVQVVRVARTTSLDDMHSENIWFSWYKPSKYREKLICHACDKRTNGRTNGKWKIGQCSVGPETAKSITIIMVL